MAVTVGLPSKRRSGGMVFMVWEGFTINLMALMHEWENVPRHSYGASPDEGIWHAIKQW